MAAAQLDMDAYKRAPWTGSFAIIGPDWSAAAYLMHVRQQWGDTGTPLLVPDIDATFDPAYTYYNPRTRQTITAPATLLAMSIDEADLESLPFAGDEEKALELVYDLHITPSGGVKVVALKGSFTVYPGSTI